MNNLCLAQAYYLAAPFPVERAPNIRVPGLTRESDMVVRVSELADYAVRGLVFELGNSYEELSLAVARTCIELQDRNFPFNVLISDRGTKVFLFPQVGVFFSFSDEKLQRNHVHVLNSVLTMYSRCTDEGVFGNSIDDLVFANLPRSPSLQCFAERQARGEVEKSILKTGVNPAVWEISGHIVLKHGDDYDGATEEYAWKLLTEVSLAEDRFEEVKTICMKAVAGVGGYVLPPSLDVISDVIRPAGDTEYARIEQKERCGRAQMKSIMPDVPSSRPYGDISFA